MINFPPIVLFYVVIFSNFDIKLIIFLQFGPGAFSQNCWIKLWFMKFPIHGGAVLYFFLSYVLSF